MGFVIDNVSKIGLIGASRISGDLITHLKSDPDLDVDFLILDKNIAGRQKLAEILHNRDFLSCENEFFAKSTSGVILAGYVNLELNKYQPKLKKLPAVFCSANYLCLLDGIKQLYKIAKGKNILVRFDLPLRYTRAFIELKNSIRKGEIGKIKQIDLTYYKPRCENSYSKRIKTNFYGGFMETGVHLLDIALNSLNYPEISEIRTFAYKGGKRIENQYPFCEDYLFATLVTEKDTLINLRCSCNLPQAMPHKIEADFHGERGNLHLQNQDDAEFDLRLEAYKDNHMEVISSPPDSYLEGAMKDWIWNLKTDKAYDERSEKEMLGLARVIEKIYQN